MRRYLVTFLLLIAVGATIGGMAAGCNDLGVGRKCLFSGGSGDGGVSGTTISSPSLECMSRLCYLQQGMMGNADRTYCTAKCTSDDDCKGALIGDPNKPTPGLCNSNFVCAIPTSVGTFACQQFCICRDDLVAGVNTDPVDGGVVCPTACANSHKCPAGK